MGDGFRWVTIMRPDHPELEVTLMKPGPPLDADMAEAIRRALASGTMGGFGLTTTDCRKTYDELRAKGVEFTQPPAERPYGVEAVMRDNSGQSSQLAPGQSVARPVTADGVPVGAARRAVSLPPVPRGVCIDHCAFLHRAPAEAAHPSADEMQCGSDGNECLEHSGEGMLVVAIVQMPAVAGVVGQTWVGGRLCEEEIDLLCAVLLVCGVHDDHPPVEHGEYVAEVVLGDREIDHDSGLDASGYQFVDGPGSAIRQISGEFHRILPVRVEMHNAITSRWSHE